MARIFLKKHRGFRDRMFSSIALIAICININSVFTVVYKVYLRERKLDLNILNLGDSRGNTRSLTLVAIEI